VGLGEIEAFRWSLKECPKCRSSEGFWLVTKRGGSYVQCKHCGAILELCEVFPATKEGSSSKVFLKGARV